jgi:hypothetical protein
MAVDLAVGRGAPGEHRYVAIAALVAAQGLDISTTLYGLQYRGMVELNPVAATAMGRLGRTPGLLSLACLTILAAIAITEVATARYGGSILPADSVRWLGYAPHVTISVLAAVNNLLVATTA